MKAIKRIFTGLNAKIQIIFIIIFISVMSLLFFSIYLVIRPDLEEKAIKDLKNNTSLIYTTIQESINLSIKNYLITRAEDVKKIAIYYYNQYTSGIMTGEDAYTAFSQIILDKDFGKIGSTGYLAGVSSKGILSIHPLSQGVDASGFDFMKKAMAMKNGYIEYDWANKGETETREKAGGMAFFEPWDIIVWASSYKEEFVELLNIDNLLTIINTMRVGEQGYPFIFDSEGRIVYHPELKDQNLLGLKDETGRYYFQEILKAAQAKPEEVQVTPYPGEKEESSGTMKIGAFIYLPEVNWVLVSCIPAKEINAILDKFAVVFLIIIAAAFILINVILSFVFSRLLKPISEIQKISLDVADGNLVPRIVINSSDEIGMMSESFNTIINKFESVLKYIRQTSQILLTSAQDFNISSQEIASTSNQQAASVKEIVSTMEDSDQLSKSIAGKIKEVTTIADNTKTIVNKGFSILKESLIKMEEIKKTNAERITGIKSLGEKIESIWEIVNIINNIADQTKIIAFNAELEASSAGEAGKNFQIVASEIRRLADSTVNSTSEIKNKINEIQHSSDHLIIASEEGTEKIRNGWELSKNLENLFNDILSSSEITASSSQQIANSINQQASAFEQILLTLKQISEGIDNFVQSTKSTSTSSAVLKKKANELTDIMSGYVVTRDNTNEE